MVIKRGTMGLLNLFTRSKAQKSGPSLEGIDLHLLQIPGAIELIDGFPRINWPIVNDATAPYQDPPVIEHVWTELAAHWLVLVGSHLGEDYKLYESNRLLFISNLPSVTRNLASIGDAAFDRLERLLEPPASDRGFGKHAVMVFGDREAYYDYISYFYPDREQAFGTSAGMHIGHGYCHTVLNGKLASVDRTLVHEMAHHMVTSRPLPTWLNEGLAQFMEDMVPAYRAPLIDHRQVRLHRRYWSWFGIEHFWNGSAFRGVASQRVSYQLADILFRNLVNHRMRGRHLREFLATAHREDAGVAACFKCFGCPLSKLVEEFLGPGEWGHQT